MPLATWWLRPVCHSSCTNKMITIVCWAYMHIWGGNCQLMCLLTDICMQVYPYLQFIFVCGYAANQSCFPKKIQVGLNKRHFGLRSYLHVSNCNNSLRGGSMPPDHTRCCVVLDVYYSTPPLPTVQYKAPQKWTSCMVLSRILSLGGKLYSVISRGSGDIPLKKDFRFTETDSDAFWEVKSCLPNYQLTKFWDRWHKRHFCTLRK